jgi:two-component system, chemotaxis family, CheB/CheR fusion protein
VVLEGGNLRLREPAKGVRVHLPIDDFFRSLAEDQGANAICIVLSGAGSDGSQGLRAVNAAGGLVMVQEEAQAEYHGMPASAIATGLADFVLPVERMGNELARFASSPLLALREKKRRTPSEQAREELGSVLAAVRAVCGHDFSQYKPSTVLRRIERRMAIHQIDQLGSYARLLRQKPAEAQALFQDMLINVTSFFRDAGAFEVLQEHLAGMLGEKGPEAPVRVWVPGCATGEEAYSIAILLLETMDRLGKQFPVKIFASDLNRRAIEIAREGIYPDSIAADVSEQRLQRFFQRNGTQFQVTGQVRSLLVFSLHDVMRDPPFSRLDLVSCRNLLIYMDSALQKKVIPLLYYGLNPGGLLLLGSSEGIGDFGDLFAPVSQKWKLFKTREGSAERLQLHLELPFFASPAARQEARERQVPAAAKQPAPGKEPKSGAEAGLRTLVERTVLEKYAQPGVLVDERDEIVYFHGETGSLLTPPRGEPSFNLLGMARGLLADELRSLLRQAREEGRRVLRKDLQLVHEGRLLTVDLEAAPVPGKGNLLLVTFEAKAPPAPPSDQPQADSRLALLERDLIATRQDLQATIEELETANEELQSANEELQANNEELQATNEELETSREELQATNEELETVNAELKRKNDELLRAQDDVNNLFAGASIGTVILDPELRIKRFTPAAAQVFKLIDTDIGRPLTDIASSLCYDRFEEDIRDVLESLGKKEAGGADP